MRINTLHQLVLIAISLVGCTQAIAQGFNSYDYELGPGDQIEIVVFGEDDLSIDSQIGDNGVINYPYIGELHASGLTIRALQDMIKSDLKGDYLVNPIVQISIAQYRPFFIDGEVEVPGGYPFQPGLTILKAAALAQGFTERASREKIFITREINGEEKIVKAELGTHIRPGDIVTVEQRFF
ncbi:polysaccharide biosynthesis/export family protein [Microbulbifer sp. YPW1]|uniref:polysaccharide biosynthesis/export family protein n=1 Tax=Microbulbifer sp. YPW1 TaxID=2745199 RepID=UPI00159783B5|nr:polysaccharide biosynthesis/export family protein [Microbulbifer sp. YPW1]QKX16580.1 polysaccharide export protein [Microbulbifer sp. YPW1]